MYAELHARSAFSFLEGSSAPEDLAERCTELGIPVIALLDKNGVYGSPRVHMEAQKLEMRAIVGTEIEGVDGARYPILVETRAGYKNLCRLITKIKMRAPKGEGAATYEELCEYADGLICLTGDENGPLAHGLKRKRPKETLEKLIHAFGAQNVYVELQRHFDRKQELRNQAAIDLADSYKLPLLATNGVCYATPDRRDLLDVMTCIKHGVKLATAGRKLSRNAERYLKSEREMLELFSDYPNAVHCSGELASRIDFTLTDLGYEFPKYPLPPGETPASFLRKQTYEGAQIRFNTFGTKQREQIEKELTVIEQLNLCGYFLIVWDIVQFCNKNGILVQGRGSAANSAVCFAMGITAVDPVAMELLFERFLSKERDEMPDIDLDLPSGDRRERVIRYVYERYGVRGSAMTANVITYRGRSSSREIGKVLGFDDSTLSRLAQLSQNFEWTDPKDKTKQRLLELNIDPEDEQIQRYLALQRQLKGLPRHLGQHSGGMVICEGDLDSIVPLEPATMPGRVVVQWDKEDCADLGLVKVDLLGLGMMAVIQDSLEMIPKYHEEPLHLYKIPEGDKAVYEALQKADTVGWFQVESRAQMSCLPRMLPAKFYDIVVQVAIIRPGPIVGRLMHPYLRRRQGREAPTCMHPCLEEILSRTLGVPLFQEQLLRVAMAAANFTGGEAEELRRALGFRRSEKRMQEVEKKLRFGMEQNGIIGKQQDDIVHAVTSFALYGFPESHAASFALLAYASGYLKCHYLAIFTATILNNQPMGFYSPETLIQDARRHGLRVHSVNVLHSDWLCTIERESNGALSVRLGYCFLKGFREKAARALVEERARKGFSNIDEICQRVPELTRDEVVQLAEVGAFNTLENCHRRGAVWEAHRATRPAGPLFDQIESSSVESPLAPMYPEERMRADFANMNLSVGPHPLLYYRKYIQDPRVIRAIELREKRNGQIVNIAGAVICRQRPGTAKGMLFISLEDETGIANLILTEDFVERNRVVVVSEPYLLAQGVLQNLDGAISIKVSRIEPLRFPSKPAGSHDFH